MSETFQLFKSSRKATFIARPNRFCLTCRLEDGAEVDAYLPNPGRLRELLLPGAQVSLIGNTSATAKTKFTAVGVFKGDRPVMLHTHRTNDVARHLIETGRVPGLEEARVVKAEKTVGRSRFDFLLEHQGRPLLLEVKSCTLFSGRVAMFPDAVTARGARHVRELAELGQEGRETAVLFVVQWPFSRLFSPDFHTDPDFARALVESREHLRIIALSIGWTPEFRLEPEARLCTIPWDLIEAEAQDRGAYLVILELKKATTLQTGALGEVRYREGFYVYVGSAMASLRRRIERHRRLRKRHHWHIDALRNSAELVDALPIRASTRLECELAAALRAITSWSIPGFGSTDCACESHLFGSPGDPRSDPRFQQMLARYRMDQFEELYAKEIPTVQRCGKSSGSV